MQTKTFTITKIPANPPVKKTVRVAAYARVSADKDAAFHSLEQQMDYYGDYVSVHPDWELVQIYSDSAISGTKEDRPAFQQILTDCRAGKIDLVVTKSITRFARNTVVLLETIRELKNRDIDVYFEKEDMHSISPDGELLLTLLAMYAEEEARSASENQRWRIKRKFEQGQTTLGRMLGYRLKDGVLTVVPEEAELVRQIFRDFLAGTSMAAIAKELNRAGIPPRFSDTWRRNTIYKILTNEKYTGSMILQKVYTPDFRTKKRVINRGEVLKYNVADSHEAIISEEDFKKVQQIFEENRKTYKSSDKTEPHLFSGLIRCGICGKRYIRRNNGSEKYKHSVWVCCRYDELGKAVCPSQAIPEKILIEKTCEILGVPELTHDIITEQIQRIEVPEPNHMVYVLKDGTPVDVLWQHHSRRESWTPEMREQARQKTLERNTKRKEESL